MRSHRRHQIDALNSSILFGLRRSLAKFVRSVAQFRRSVLVVPVFHTWRRCTRYTSNKFTDIDLIIDSFLFCRILQSRDRLITDAELLISSLHD